MISPDQHRSLQGCPFSENYSSQFGTIYTLVVQWRLSLHSFTNQRGIWDISTYPYRPMKVKHIYHISYKHFIHGCSGRAWIAWGEDLQREELDVEVLPKGIRCQHLS